MPVLLFFFPIAVMRYVEHLGFVLVSCLTWLNTGPFTGRAPQPQRLTGNLGDYASGLAPSLTHSVRLGCSLRAMDGCHLKVYTTLSVLMVFCHIKVLLRPHFSVFLTKVAGLVDFWISPPQVTLAVLVAPPQVTLAVLVDFCHIKVLLRDTLLRLPV